MYSEISYLLVITEIRNLVRPVQGLLKNLVSETQGLGIPLSKVGFPIRKSTDQSFFAAPRGLSQRSTSFIASQRQGIHRMPLRHLITLIINAHPWCQPKVAPGIDTKTSFTRSYPAMRAVSSAPEA